MPTERRHRTALYAEILESIERRQRAGGAKVTPVQQDANVPTVRFREYLDDLQHRGFVRMEPDLQVTEEGLRYLQEYRKVRAFLERFGFSGNHDARP